MIHTRSCNIDFFVLHYTSGKGKEQLAPAWWKWTPLNFRWSKDHPIRLFPSGDISALSSRWVPMMSSHKFTAFWIVVGHVIHLHPVSYYPTENWHRTWEWPPGRGYRFLFRKLFRFYLGFPGCNCPSFCCPRSTFAKVMNTPSPYSLWDICPLRWTLWPMLLLFRIVRKCIPIHLTWSDQMELMN